MIGEIQIVNEKLILDSINPAITLYNKTKVRSNYYFNIYSKEERSYIHISPFNLSFCEKIYNFKE